MIAPRRCPVAAGRHEIGQTLTETSTRAGAEVGTGRPIPGYQAIPELIRRSGVPAVFGVLGEINAAWVGEGVRSGAFRYVRTRHEAAAVSAAAGFSRVTGMVGLSTVTRGPGFANGLNALKAAAHDHVPILVLVGESPPSQVNISPYYHNLEQRAISEAIGVGFHHAAGADELADCFWAAVHGAQWNGLPQVLSIGDGMLEAAVTLPAAAPVPAPHTCPDPDAVAAAVEVLATAKRPLILAGQGAVHSGCRSELEELATLVGARVASTLNVNRFFSGYPNDLGVCGHSSPTLVADLICETDVVLAVGASFNPYTTARGTLFAQATVIQIEIDIEQPFHATRPELGLLGDARDVTLALIAEWRRRGLPGKPVAGATPTREEVAASVLEVDLGHDARQGLDLRQVFASLDARLPRDRVVVSDSGRWSATLPTFLDARDGRSWLITRGYGSIGLGLGNAIGACVGAPDRPVVLFSGDGGFMLSVQDLDALRLNGLDLTVVIINDEQYGAEVAHLSSYGLPPDVARQTLPDIEKLAEAFGGHAAVVRTREELDAVDLAHRGVLLLDVRVDPHVNGRAAL